MTRDAGARGRQARRKEMAALQRGAFAYDPKGCSRTRYVLPELKDIVLTRGCALRNYLKIKCIPFLSVSKVGQRQTDGDLALQGGRKNFSRNPYPQNKKMGTFKD